MVDAKLEGDISDYIPTAFVKLCGLSGLQVFKNMYKLHIISMY